MASTAISAKGSTVKVDLAAKGTPDTLIKNMITFSGFDGETSEIDVTNCSSTAKEFVPGLQDFGSFSIEWHTDYSDPGQSALRSAQVSGATKTMLLTLPNGDTAKFAVIVKNSQAISGGSDVALTGSATLKITGAVTITSKK